LIKKRMHMTGCVFSCAAAASVGPAFAFVIVIAPAEWVCAASVSGYFMSELGVLFGGFIPM
jgi:hypothetical protein